MYDETGGSPLALMWTIGLIVTRGLSFEGALELLRNGSLENDLNLFLYREAQNTMDPGERNALGALSFFGDSASFAALSTTANLDRRALDSVIERLIAMSLIDVAEGRISNEAIEERYSLHPLTRRFAKSDLSRDTEAESLMGQRFTNYWVEYAVQNSKIEIDPLENFKKLEREWPNLYSAAKWLHESAVGNDDILKDEAAAIKLVELVDTVERFLWNTGFWKEYVELHIWAYESANALKDWLKAGEFAYNLAFNFYTRLVINQADEWISKAEKAWSHENEDIHQAIVVQMRGNLAAKEGTYDRAEELLHKALSVWQRLQLDSNLALVLKDLGELATKRGHHTQASAYYEKALELAKLLDQKEGLCEFMCCFGNLEAERDEWSKARGWFEEALALARQLGLVNMIALTQYGLARSWKGLNKPDRAVALAQESLLIFQRLQYMNVPDVEQFINECNLSQSFEQN